MQDAATKHTADSREQMQDAATRRTAGSCEQMQDAATRRNVDSSEQMQDAATRRTVGASKQMQDVATRRTVGASKQMQDGATRRTVGSIEQMQDAATSRTADSSLETRLVQDSSRKQMHSFNSRLNTGSSVLVQHAETRLKTSEKMQYSNDKKLKPVGNVRMQTEDSRWQTGFVDLMTGDAADWRLENSGDFPISTVNTIQQVGFSPQKKYLYRSKGKGSR